MYFILARLLFVCKRKTNNKSLKRLYSPLLCSRDTELRKFRYLHGLFRVFSVIREFRDSDNKREQNFLHIPKLYISLIFSIKPAII